MKTFKNIKQAHEHYKFPGSYRIGAIIKDNLIIRIYSNGKSAPDFFRKNGTNFFYVLKSDKIMNAFKNTKTHDKSISVFTRDIDNNLVIYHGLFKVKGFRTKENIKYVLLEK